MNLSVVTPTPQPQDTVGECGGFFHFIYPVKPVLVGNLLVMDSQPLNEWNGQERVTQSVSL